MISFALLAVLSAAPSAGPVGQSRVRLLSVETHEALLQRRRALEAEEPGLRAPVGLLVGSGGLGVFSGVMAAVFAGGGGFQSPGSATASAQTFTFSVALAAALGHVALGIIGTVQMRNRIQEREVYAQRIAEVDAELERTERTPAAPPPPQLVPTL